MISNSSDSRRGLQQLSAKNVLLVFLMILITLVSEQIEYSRADLEDMTEVELENICVQRGFELVNDELDKLTKQDYIEAAQRCLAIEQEMNELLAQYPDLADELEEEIKRMEKENSEKRDYVEALESEISNNDSTDHNAKNSDVTFAQPMRDAGVKIAEKIVMEKPVMPHEAPVNKKTNYSFSADNEKLKEPNINNEIEGIEVAQLGDFIEEEDVTNNVGKKIESRELSAEKEDLTLTHIAIESLRVLVKNAQDDVKRIINLAIPVLQPVFDVGDTAWRQIKAIFIRAREAYVAYQTVSTPSTQASGESETCDDCMY